MTEDSATNQNLGHTAYLLDRLHNPNLTIDERLAAATEINERSDGWITTRHGNAVTITTPSGAISQAFTIGEKVQQSACTKSSMA